MIFKPDLDPATTTNPLNDDPDNDGWLDGEEDKNHNGRLDASERYPCLYNLVSRFTPSILILLLE